MERYVLGRVVDIGGSTEANVHLVLEDTGKRIKATSTEEYLRDQRERTICITKVQLQIAAHENIQTGELRDVRLLAFVGEGPSYDERELEALIEKGTRAWSDVPDSRSLGRESNEGASMSDGAVLDTGFLISLVDRNRPCHDAARKYYRYFL